MNTIIQLEDEQIYIKLINCPYNHTLDLSVPISIAHNKFGNEMMIYHSDVKMIGHNEWNILINK
jgi:hypothetical protein